LRIHQFKGLKSKSKVKSQKSKLRSQKTEVRSQN
jgi:hypothetical protein